MRTTWIWVLALALTVGACSEPAEQPEPVATPGADSPSEAVSGLISAMAEGDYERAAELTVDGQAVAVAASEGLAFPELAIVAESDDPAIVARFWESFAANLESLVETSISETGVVGEPTEFQIDDLDFARIEIGMGGAAASGPTLVTRHVDGWKIDLVASFPAVLATRIPETVDRAGSAVEGGVVIDALAQLRPSLEAGLEEPGLPATTGTIIRNAILAFES